jgi:hypothetical protein
LKRLIRNGVSKFEEIWESLKGTRLDVFRA